MATHKKPFHTLRSGGMQAAIWLNDGIKGPFVQRQLELWGNDN